MKFFHLSDLHIGLKLVNHDLYEDQKHILTQIVDLAQKRQPDAVLIAGDIYDKAIPSAEAVSLFDYFITALTQALSHAEIMLISGNHDSAQRVDVFRQVLSRHKIQMIGLPPRTPEEYIAQVTLT
ncbi:MAG: exonuclease subunit SbcD, partial [Selenomonas sp.]|nr:exonuclease subunit SbcD [Selenomonas sp.]